MARSPEPVSGPATPDLIGGVYTVDPSRSLGDAGGGVAAFAAEDRQGRSEAVALQVSLPAPPRARAIASLAGTPLAGLMSPLAYGIGRARTGSAAYVICTPPPGPSLVAAPPMTEGAALDLILRPVAAVLESLYERNITHRAIRPDNLFRAGLREPVTLGAAWAEPAAWRQPAVFEPPYVTLCPPAGRGEGTTGDDVYALGVTLIALVLGRVPMAGMDTEAITRRKLELGSYPAIVGEDRLPPAIAELARGMLAEDPDHRPTPAMLADPAAARARRIATRPARRAQRPLELGGLLIWEQRLLALGLASAPDVAIRMLRTGLVDRWLRRSLSDTTLAGRVEEAVRLRAAEPGEDARADAMLLLRTIPLFDPLAPPTWRGLSFWPDAVGTLLATGDGPAREVLQDALGQEVLSVWAMTVPDRHDVASIRMEARQHRAVLRVRGWGGGIARLRYALNPLLPCDSPVLRGTPVYRVADLLSALERASVVGDGPSAGPIDADIAALIAARSDQRLENDLAELAETGADRAGVLQLRILAALQLRAGPQPPPTPALAGWLAKLAAPVLATWRDRDRRERMEAQTREAVTTGQLARLLTVLDDAAARTADAQDARAAEDRVAEIDARLAALTRSSAERGRTAAELGAEITQAFGLLAAAAAVAFAILG